MAKTRYSIVIIFLFTTLLLGGCAAVDDLNNAWQNRDSYNPNAQVSPPSANQPISSSNENAAALSPTGFENLPAVKVALLLPLSGANGALGQSMLQGAQLALFDMGYTNYNLMPRDTSGTAAGAVGAAQSALNDGAQIILGPVFSDAVQAVKPLARARNVNMIAFSTDEKLADSRTYLMGFMPTTQVDRLANYAAAKGFGDVALVAPNDAYGDLVAARFNTAIHKAGGSLAQTIRFAQGDANVVNKIAELKNSTRPFRAVFMPVGGSQVETLSSALSLHNMMPAQIKRLGTGLWDDPRIAAQPNMQGGWFAGPSPRARANFEQKYQSTFGQRPMRLATLAYDATALTATLARNGYVRENKPDFTATALTNPNGFMGTDGIFRFNSNGMVERALAVLELQNGKIVEIDPAPPRF